MSIEENKAIVRRLVEEGFSLGDRVVLQEILGPDYVYHDLVWHPEPPGGAAHGDDAEGARQSMLRIRNAFPDSRWQVEDQVAEGDKVMTRSTFAGTHQGDFLGFPPTGRKVTIQIVVISRLENGKLVEHWALPDFFGLSRQLAPQGAPAA